MDKIDNARGGNIPAAPGANIADPGQSSRFNGGGARDTRGKKTVEDMPPINKNLEKYLISDRIIELLNNQLQDELVNHNLYRTFSLYYRSKGLHKLEHYFELRAQEEMLHHNWIFAYLAYCGIPLQYPEIPAINVDVTNELDPFKLTQEKEIETTSTINEIAKQCLAEGDFGTLCWLNGEGAVDGELIPEQTEEMSISNDVYRIACQQGDWLSKEDKILDYYCFKRKED